MSIINNELEILKEKLLKDFVDPLPKNVLKTFISVNSKFIRSRLIILYLKSLDIELSDEIYNVLSGGELIHSASLLHDDVIDDAVLRRGKPTISSKISSKVAIVAGDYLLSLAIEKIISLRNFEILNLFKDCTREMAEAELRQFFLRGRVPHLDEYIDICKGKTAGLFYTMLESSALLAGISPEQAARFGELFGLSFQIKNDYEEKSAELDSKNGIYTVKDILGIEKTNALLDNYKEEMIGIVKEFPENVYKRELEGLIISL